MYEKYFNQLKEECLIRNRSSQTAETYIAMLKKLYWKTNMMEMLDTIREVR